MKKVLIENKNIIIKKLIIDKSKGIGLQSWGYEIPWHWNNKFSISKSSFDELLQVIFNNSNESDTPSS